MGFCAGRSFSDQIATFCIIKEWQYALYHHITSLPLQWQGCLLTPIIFILVIDWVIRGILWILIQQLEYPDFADDIKFLSQSHKHIQTTQYYQDHRTGDQHRKKIEEASITIGRQASSVSKMGKTRPLLLWNHYRETRPSVFIPSWGCSTSISYGANTWRHINYLSYKLPSTHAVTDLMHQVARADL